MAHNVKQSILNKARVDKFILVLNTPTCLQDKASKTTRTTHHKSAKKVMPDSMQFSVFGTVVPEVTVPAAEQHYAGQSLNISSHNRPTYGEVSVNFTIDNEYNNYWYIWRWLDVLNDSKESHYDVHDNNPKARPSAKGFRDPHKHGMFQLDDSHSGGRPKSATSVKGLPDPHKHGMYELKGAQGSNKYPQRPDRYDKDKGDVNLLLDYQTDLSLFGIDEYNKRKIEFKYTKAFPTTLGDISFSHRESGEIESSFSFAFSQMVVNLL